MSRFEEFLLRDANYQAMKHFRVHNLASGRRALTEYIISPTGKLTWMFCRYL